MLKRSAIVFTVTLIAIAAFAVSVNAQNVTVPQKSIQISGEIDFPPHSWTEDINDVSDLTIYFVNERNGYVGQVSPDKNGRFSINVPYNGTYSIRVFQPELISYADAAGNEERIVYPDGKERKYIINVPDTGKRGFVIEYYPKGEYKNHIEEASNQVIITPPPATPTPSTQATTNPASTQSPGFTILALLIALVAAAVVYNKR